LRADIAVGRKGWADSCALSRSPSRPPAKFTAVRCLALRCNPPIPFFAITNPAISTANRF